MVVMILKKEKIIDFKYFSEKTLGYYFYILINKIRRCDVKVVEEWVLIEKNIWNNID